jgi:hypothetical protein
MFIGIRNFLNHYRWKLAFYYLRYKEYWWLGRMLLTKEEKSGLRVIINKKISSKKGNFEGAIEVIEINENEQV